MATLSVKFIKTTKREGALYCDKSVIKSLSFVGRRIMSEEKKNGYELVYYCRKTKTQSKCWLVKSNGLWSIFCDDIPSAMNYDSMIVNVM